MEMTSLAVREPDEQQERGCCDPRRWRRGSGGLDLRTQSRPRDRSLSCSSSALKSRRGALKSSSDRLTIS